MNFSASARHLRGLTVALFMLALAACSNAPVPKHYELQGRVVAVDLAARQLTIAHQDIPGLMKGMTMPFIVGKSSNWIFKTIAPGDSIHATLVLSDHAELQDISSLDSTRKESDGTSATANSPARRRSARLLACQSERTRPSAFISSAASPCCSRSSTRVAPSPTTAFA